MDSNQKCILRLKLENASIFIYASFTLLIFSFFLYFLQVCIYKCVSGFVQGIEDKSSRKRSVNKCR